MRGLLIFIAYIVCLCGRMLVGVYHSAVSTKFMSCTIVPSSFRLQKNCKCVLGYFAELGLSTSKSEGDDTFLVYTAEEIAHIDFVKKRVV